MKEFIVSYIADLDKVADYVVNHITKSKIILLTGEMGSGKTTFVNSFVKILGSKDQVSSPTFSIVNEYIASGFKIYHFDLFRLLHIKELQEIGFEEYLDGENYCIIEWPKLAFPLLPNNFVSIDIQLTTNEIRRFAVSNTTNISKEL